MAAKPMLARPFVGAGEPYFSAKTLSYRGVVEQVDRTLAEQSIPRRIAIRPTESPQSI